MKNLVEKRYQPRAQMGKISDLMRRPQVWYESSMKCPCGSNKEYDACCGLFHSGEAQAPTAEHLMRSRYAAFVKNDMTYLQETTDPQTLTSIDEEANREWAEHAQFKKLEILSAEEKGTKGIVEFKAHYALDGEDYIHHEISTFRKQAGQWFFKSGKIKEEKPEKAKS